MSNIEKIRQEIERRLKYTHDWLRGDERTLDALLAFIDSLPDENNPEPYNPVYDEDYLNEKIAKATKSWEGVDVNKMLADCRGYEEKPSEDFPTSDEEMAKFLATHPKVEVPEKYKTPNWLFDKQPSEDKEEVAEKYADKHGFRVPYDGSNNYYDDVDVKASKEGFLAGAEWALNQGVKATGIISPRGIIYDNNIGYRLFLERYHNGDKVEVQVRKIEENGK